MLITKINNTVPQLPKRKNVAAYARVSTDKDAMRKSLAAQVSYYSELIQRNPDWEYAGVFADEAQTGTKDTRTQFQALLTKCRNGEIDMIITKSITRFARNTVTLLETVRELKTLGADVYFEEQNIHSASEDGEFALTLLASFAQEESLSVSENCKWRIRKRFEAGDPAITWRMYGYTIKNGEMALNEEQAAVIRQMFEEYVNGIGVIKLTHNLNNRNVPAYNGGVWNTSAVLKILKNEKLIGDCLCQKTYITDHITKKPAMNNGERPQYYIENIFPPIIERGVFEEAQIIMAKRRTAPGGKRNVYQFTSKIVCGICGKHFRRYKNGGQQKWHCTTYVTHGKSACASKQIPESVLERLASEVGEFDEILVNSPNTVIFRLTDDSSVEKSWQDRSRRDSWTEEMKAKARLKALERRTQNA